MMELAPSPFMVALAAIASITSITSIALVGVLLALGHIKSAWVLAVILLPAGAA
jgi:hypothetical protein